jgi:hypothetical protein
MTTLSRREELLRNFDRLSPAKQQELLAYACSLTESAPVLKGSPGKELAIFGGVIEPGELARISQAIEEDCERVDRSAW